MRNNICVSAFDCKTCLVVLQAKFSIKEFNGESISLEKYKSEKIVTDHKRFKFINYKCLEIINISH